MPPFILLLLSLMIFACAFGYMTFRHEVERRAAAALEKKRNQYHDRAWWPGTQGSCTEKRM